MMVIQFFVFLAYFLQYVTQAKTMNETSENFS